MRYKLEFICNLLGCSESNFVFSREKEGPFIRIWNTFLLAMLMPDGGAFDNGHVIEK